jgi:hypothetical protein
MAPAGWGRAGEPVGNGSHKPAQAELVAGEVTGDANRIEYRRGGLVETYRNDDNGLEQRFVLLEAPAPGEGLLRLELVLAGDLTPRPAEGAADTAIELRDGEDRPVLRHSLVAASDAAGRSLPSRLALEAQPGSGDDDPSRRATLALIVDDAGATYPIDLHLTIVGLPPVDDWSVTYTQDDAQFGYAVATAGDVNGDGYSDVIVGAPYFDGGLIDEGLAMVFRGSAAGLDEAASWYKESDQAGARYGFSVATAGDVDGDGDTEVIVGAPDYDHPEVGEGGAWVYYGSPAGLSLTPGEFYQGTQEGAACGISVSTAGDVNGDGYADVIVGASLRSDRVAQAEEGYALVYYGSAAGLSNGFNWHAEGEQSGASLGRAVATAGDVNGDGFADVIVGADRYDDPSEDEGKVFVWYGSTSGLNGGMDGTPANADWSAQIDSGAARFGWSVSTAGDVNGDGYADVIVGAPYYANGQANEGAARLYLGSESGLLPDWANHDEGNQAGAHFGQSVATAGDVNGDGRADVIVGAPYYANGESQEGRAFVWYGSADGISATRDWMGEGNAVEAWYGSSVATAGDVNGDGYSDVLVGAPGRRAHGGAALAYYGGPDTLNDTAEWTKAAGREYAHFGHSAASAGDVNADGYADVIIGAPGWDGGQASEGSAWVYIGHPYGLGTTPMWHKEGDQIGAQFGWSVGSAGDVNGDGYEEVIVGAPTYNNGETDEGQVWVYMGSNSGPNLAPAWYKDSDQADARYGTAVGTAGDVNGDGYADVVVGAPYYNHPETDEGGAWIYEGSAEGLHVAPDWHGQCDQAGANFGASVGTAGDVNGDGYSDLIVGAPFWDDGQLNEGGAWVYLGSPGGMAQTDSWRWDSGQAGANYGAAVGTAGDVNGDGLADIIVGAPHFTNGQEDEGKAFVYHGAGSGLNPVPAWMKEANQAGAMFGGSVGTAGDVNGDGYADIIVGAHMWSGGLTNEGGAWVYHGSATGVHVVPDWHTEGEQAGAQFGTAVATAGDVNSDAYADVIIGAPRRQVDHTEEGQALIFYGNQGKGVALRLYQEAHTGRNLARLGRLLAGENFWLGAFAAYPFGRTKYRWEIETKPLRVGFDAHDTYVHGPAWSSLPPGSFVGLLGARDLPPGTAYHWRLRMRYNPATTPFMPASRWVTIPWNGWNEEDFRTAGSRLRLPLVLRNGG